MANELLTEQSLWDDIWTGVDEPWEFLPEIVWVHHVWARLFTQLLPKPPGTCLEIGCGGSPYLPWIASKIGLTAYGLDYSTKGIELCQKALAKKGVTGHLIYGDFFADNQLPSKAFDAVVSFGFVEHFTNTSVILARMAEYVKPGGTLLATVPNLKGINGLIMRTFDRELFDKHVLMTPLGLAASFHQAGITEITFAGYFGSICLGSTSWKSILQRLGTTGGEKFLKSIYRIDQWFWRRFYSQGSGFETAFTSPHVLVCGKLPQG